MLRISCARQIGEEGADPKYFRGGLTRNGWKMFKMTEVETWVGGRGWGDEKNSVLDMLTWIVGGNHRVMISIRVEGTQGWQ